MDADHSTQTDTKVMLGTPAALRWRNAAATCGVIALALGWFCALPLYQRQLAEIYGWSSQFRFSGYEFLAVASIGYALVLCIHYAIADMPLESKSLRFWRAAVEFVRAPIRTWRSGLAPDTRLAVLATILKGFFGPLMVLILLRTVFGAVAHAQAVLEAFGAGSPWIVIFNQHGFWLAITLIVAFDVTFFTAGYLIELPSLGNEIKSVDPTLLGWAAALLCYYPFSPLTGMVLGREVSDFPQFDDTTMHVALNGALLLLMAVYASASAALGLKASNLTHRGIVTRGPYAFVRHPAYVCKNLAWWIGAIPAVTQAFSISWFAGISSVASVVGWSLLYVLRAVTEEDHLKRVDGDYAAYAARVRWRFIPGVV